MWAPKHFCYSFVQKNVLFFLNRVCQQADWKQSQCQKIDHKKLQHFGHIARREGDNLEKIMVQGHVEGKRKRGRQKIRWSDVIKEITGLDVCTASRYAQDRDGWNVIICRSTKGQTWPTGLDDDETVNKTSVNTEKHTGLSRLSYYSSNPV